MKKSAFLIIFFILLQTVNCFAANLFSNPGFEEGSGRDIYYWNKYVWDEKPGTADVALDLSTKHTGNSSLKIVANVATDARIKQQISVKPDSFYKITSYIKTENIGANAKGANISADGIVETSADIRSTSDWKEVILYGKTNKEQNTVVLTFGLGGYGSLNTGKVWFDDVQVEELLNLPEGTHAISLSPTNNSSSDNSAASGNKSILPYVLLGIFILIVALLILIILRDKKHSSTTTSSLEKIQDLEDSNKRIFKVDRKDVIILSAMTIVYLGIALFNLGSLHTPTTEWSAKKPGESFVIDFGKQVNLSRVYYYCGMGDGKFRLETESNGKFVPLATVEKKDIFSLKYTNLTATTSKIRFVADSTDFTLNELYFVEAGTESALDGFKIIDSQNNVDHLFDEQKSFVYRPSYLTNMYFDEIYHARTAYEHIHKLSVFEWTHPPLGKIFIALGVLIFGMNPFGWRIIGTLFGAAMIPLMYLFGIKLFDKKIWGFCAAFLMMFDFMHFTQTRIATIDVYATFFIIGMYYYMYDVFMVKSYNIPYKASIKQLFLSSIFFAIGVASKWIVLYGGAGLALLFFAAKYLEYLDYRNITSSKKITRPHWTGSFISKNIVATMLFCSVFFVIIPLVVYYASYLPYMAVPGSKQGFKLVWDFQIQMYNYHSRLIATHPFSSPWYEWPIIYKPTWFYSGSDVLPGNASTITTMGNPAIWWVGILAFFLSIYYAIKRNDKKMIVIFAAITFQYLPWVLVPRITWIYHFFSTVPFMILCIVYVLSDIYKRNTNAKYLIYCYLSLVLLLFVWFYPALSGLEVSKNYIDSLKWFNSWIF